MVFLVSLKTSDELLPRWFQSGPQATLCSLFSFLGDLVDTIYVLILNISSV